MPFKINISEKSGKTYKLEAEAPGLIGKELGQTFQGKELNPDLEGYEFEITGTSDKSGFTSMENIDGVGLKKVLLSYEKGMKTRPKHEGKKTRSKKKPKGLRLRKTVRGKVISEAITQINIKVLKEGNKKLADIFKPAEVEKPAEPSGEKKK